MAPPMPKPLDRIITNSPSLMKAKRLPDAEIRKITSDRGYAPKGSRDCNIYTSQGVSLQQLYIFENEVNPGELARIPIPGHNDSAEEKLYSLKNLLPVGIPKLDEFKDDVLYHLVLTETSINDYTVSIAEDDGLFKVEIDRYSEKYKRQIFYKSIQLSSKDTNLPIKIAIRPYITNFLTTELGVKSITQVKTLDL